MSYRSDQKQCFLPPSKHVIPISSVPVPVPDSKDAWRMEKRSETKRKGYKYCNKYIVSCSIVSFDINCKILNNNFRIQIPSEEHNTISITIWVMHGLMDDNYKSYIKPLVHPFIRFCSKIFSHSDEQLFRWEISPVALSFLQKQWFLHQHQHKCYNMN